MRLAILAAALLSTAAVRGSADAGQVDMQTSDRWHAKAREIYARAISFQTVQGRNQSPQLAAYLQEQFRAGGLTDVTIHPHDDTAALILRWPAARPSGRKAILLMAHMDVVEARRADWSRDPFELGEEGGYFYGRGTLDDKQGVTAITTALLRLRAENFSPGRDIIVLFTGDEETGRQRRRPRRQRMDRHLDARFRAQRRCRRRRLSRRRPAARLRHPDRREDLSELHFDRDQSGRAQLAAAARQCDLRARPCAAAGRAAPLRADAERDHARLCSPTALQNAEPALAAAIRRWLADPDDGEAADIVEASPTEVGMTRTRCVATRLEGGHADNALPQLARATVNCRIFPGVDPATVLAALRELGAPDNIDGRAGRRRPPDRRLAAARGRGGGLYGGRARPPSRTPRSSPT